MKPECPIDWKTAFTAALLGFLGAYLIGGYLNMPDAGAIVAIAYVGGRILWYLKRLEARQEPKDTVADAPADTAAADTTPEVVCRYAAQNNQCIGKRCPFSAANRTAK